MRAIQQTQFGGPEVLELVDLPVPEPADGEILIRVSRAGMNFADTHQRRNDYLAAQQLPLVPGGEVAGVREDTGQRVVALSGTGGYAEYATAPEALTFPIPDGVDDGTGGSARASRSSSSPLRAASARSPSSSASRWARAA
jgi:NADPH2:quinone reductase